MKTETENLKKKYGREKWSRRVAWKDLKKTKKNACVCVCVCVCVCERDREREREETPLRLIYVLPNNNDAFYNNFTTRANK